MACTIFLWDLIITFGMEVDLVWKSKGNFMKWLYLFQRYWPFTEIAMLCITSQSDVFPIFLFSLVVQVHWGKGWGRPGVGGHLMLTEVRKNYLP